MAIPRVVLAMVAVVSAIVLTGCGHTPGWKDSFEPARPQMPVFPPVEKVQVRIVSSDQVNESNQRVGAFLTERRIAPEDLGPADARALRVILLDAFRMRDDPDLIAVLGTSVFVDTSAASSSDRSLHSFARSIGADIVVLSTTYAGQVLAYENAPVFSSGTSYGSMYDPKMHGRGRGYGQGDGRGYGWGYFQGYSSSTTYVPVQVTYDQWTNAALFMRRITPDQRAAIDRSMAEAAPAE